jgi:hypothetical protein
MAVNQKRTHFGRAGEFFAMSEILLRGWNVAVPVVDVGDDVFIIDDNDKSTLRLQVKSSRLQVNTATSVSSVKYTLSRKQLREEQPIELLYMFMIRNGAKWSFLVIPGARLDELHREYLGVTRAGRGRRPKTDDDAKTDALTFEISFTTEGPKAWGVSLAEFFESWPESLPELESGPGSVRGRNH